VIITIDGPAGAGKSTVARRLAERLGFRFLDTGAMYRAVALAGLRAGVDWSRPDELVRVAERSTIRFDGDRILLDGEDVSDPIRTLEVTAVTRYSAGNAAVRQRLVALQREAAAGGNMVTEGRDQGTVAFPDAACKIFLTASPRARAERRLRELAARGEAATLDEVLAAQERRDREDSSREVGPLRPAEDAILVDTDGLTVEQVVDRLEFAVRAVLARDSQ
jgi:cytidylate kinase